MPSVRKVLFSLMGSQPGPVYNATQLLEWNDLIIFYSEKFIEEAMMAKGKLKELHADAEIDIRAIDPFDMRSGIAAIIEVAADVIRKNRNKERRVDLSFNITGGTDVMTSAALLAGIMLEANIYYIKTKRDEETGEYHNPQIVDIEPPRLFIDEIDDQKFRIMEEVKNHSNNLTIAKLAELAGFNSSSALKRHLDTLEEKGIVQSTREGRNRYISLTYNGEMFLLLREAISNNDHLRIAQ